MYNVTDKINISADAIRSRARQLKLDTLDDVVAYDLWDAQCRERPKTIAGQFYHVATDRQRTRVLNLAVRKYNKQITPHQKKLILAFSAKLGGEAAIERLTYDGPRLGISPRDVPPSKDFDSLAGLLYAVALEWLNEKD
jgi:hypothetical protein